MITAGNTRQQATDIALTPQARSLPGQLTANDRNDFYRFSVNVPRNLHLSLHGIRSSAGANVSLLSFAGKRLLSLDHQELRQKNRVILETGTYFIRVSRSQGNTNYRLKLAAPLHVDRAGNRFDTARSLNLSQKSPLFKDFVSPSSDPIDTYRFQLSREAVLSGFVAGQIASVQAQILNSQGKSIATLTAKFTDLRFDAGTYYLQIQSLRRATGYSLSLSQTPYFDQAGNTWETGRWITLNSDSDRYTDFVSRSLDSADYYVFDLSAKSTKFSAALKHDRSQDIELELRNSKGAPIDIDLSSDDEAVLAAGTYFIRVRPQSDRLTRYTLELAGLSIADGGGDSRATATRFDRVFFGNVSFTLQDFVGVGDRVDYYKLLVAERLNLRLSSPQAIAVLSSEPVQLQYDLITDSGVQISLNNDNVGANLSPGTYYLRVAAVRGNATYTLPVRLRYLQLGG